MKRTRHEKNREEKRKEGLRLKLRRELPPDEVNQLTDISHLEAKKKVADSIANAHQSSPRTTEKSEALKFEEAAEGVVVDETGVKLAVP